MGCGNYVVGGGLASGCVIIYEARGILMFLHGNPSRQDRGMINDQWNDDQTQGT